jgi:hypothetical protein
VEREGGGMREGSGVAAGIAALLTTSYLVLAFVLVVVLYLFFSVVLLVHGTDVRSTTINVPLMLGGVAVITGTLITLLYVAVSVIGRSLTPPKRRD